MKKIYTIRDTLQQQAYMWDGRRIEDEVDACSKRNLTAYFLKYLPKNEPILEAGCGLGAWVIYLREHGYDIAGIDHDARVIERLKEYAPSLKVAQGDIKRLPFADASLGAYISLGVVEHFEEGCGEALQEAYRVLEPGGLIFITVPLNNIFRRLVAHPLRSLYLFWRKRKGDSVHFVEYRYSKRELEILLRKHHFELIRSDWDDFMDKRMSLGIWADFPQLHGKGLYDLNFTGRALAFLLNALSRWTAAAGVLCLAKKTRAVRSQTR